MSDRIDAIQYMMATTLRDQARPPTFVSVFRQHKDDLKQIVEDETAHRSVRVRVVYDNSLAVTRVGVSCNTCEKGFFYAMSDASLLHRDWICSPDMLRWDVKNAMLDIVETAKGCRCAHAIEDALLAEWLTTRLATAGELGMPYSQLVHEAIEARLVSPADVSERLREMRFLAQEMLVPTVILPRGWDGEWTAPIIQLPEGHPMRTW